MQTRQLNTKQLASKQTESSLLQRDLNNESSFDEIFLTSPYCRWIMTECQACTDLTLSRL
eukprot:4438244-Amphidinium_carterae.1